MSRKSPCAAPSTRGEVRAPSPLDVVWNSSVLSSITTDRGDGDSLWVEHMKAALELFLLGERLRLPK
jgi:hypothetical protein